MLNSGTIEAVLNVTALGLIALLIVVGYGIAQLVVRDRKASREAELKMHGDEQETLRQRDTDTKERESHFFSSIENIEKLADAVERHVDFSVVTEQQAKERDENVIRALQIATSTLEGIHATQNTMLTEQITIKNIQGKISSAITRDVDIAVQTLAEVKRGGKKVEEVLVILKHIQETHQQAPTGNHDIVIDEDAPKDDDMVTSVSEEDKNETA